MTDKVKQPNITLDNVQLNEYDRDLIRAIFNDTMYLANKKYERECIGELITYVADKFGYAAGYRGANMYMFNHRKNNPIPNERDDINNAYPYCFFAHVLPHDSTKVAMYLWAQENGYSEFFPEVLHYGSEVTENGQRFHLMIVEGCLESRRLNKYPRQYDMWDDTKGESQNVCDPVAHIIMRYFEQRFDRNDFVDFREAAKGCRKEINDIYPGRGSALVKVHRKRIRCFSELGQQFGKLTNIVFYNNEFRQSRSGKLVLTNGVRYFTGRGDELVERFRKNVSNGEAWALPKQLRYEHKDAYGLIGQYGLIESYMSTEIVPYSYEHNLQKLEETKATTFTDIVKRYYV